MSQDRLDTLVSNRNAGFSLTELLVVIVMFGMITAAAYSLFREQGRISRAQQSILDMQSDGRAALNLLAQIFSHAGFGNSQSSDRFFSVTDSNPDVVTIKFGHKCVAKTDVPITTTPTKEIYYILESEQSIQKGNEISIYPSINPNVTHTVSAVGPPLAIENDVIFIPRYAKIFRVFPVKIFRNTDNGNLYLEDSDGEAEIVPNVAAFEIAYMEKGSSTWKEGDYTSNPQAIYIYTLYCEPKKKNLDSNRAILLNYHGTKRISQT